MNNILECFETGAFNELMQFSFNEVREAFNLNGYFVLEEQWNQFVQEASQAKAWYTEELKKIEEYALGEHTEKVNSGDDVPEFETPQYKIQTVETQTKRKLIRLIAEYFNHDLHCSSWIFNDAISSRKLDIRCLSLSYHAPVVTDTEERRGRRVGNTSSAIALHTL